MRTFTSAMLGGVLVSLGAVAAPPPARVAVTGDRVCLRAGPLDRAEVVCQVSTNDTLVALDLSAEWVPVVPPGSAAMFVSADWVSNGVVTGGDVYVRCGPGANYPPLGYVQKGDRVEVRRREGAWLQVAPPPGVRVWINRRYVSPLVSEPNQPLTAADKSAPAPIPGIQSVENRTVAESAHRSAESAHLLAASVSTAAPPAALRQAVTGVPERVSEVVRSAPVVQEAPVVVPLDASACLPVYSGLVDRCEWVVRRPTEYRIVRRDSKNRLTTVCFVSGKPEEMRRLLGRSVRVSGVPLGMHDTRIPIVSAGNLTVVEE